MHMNKSRIEAFSDSVFAVAMTLLVTAIRIPVLADATEAQIAQIVGYISPVIVLYMATFLVLAVLWINHHYIFHAFAKEVNRQLNLMNMVYLMFIVLVPFSVQLISTYGNSKTAVIVFGVNLFIIVFLSTLMTRYIRRNAELKNPALSQRVINQAQFRARLSLLFYPLGIICSFFWIPGSIFFYTFPVLFNIIPGTVDLVEKYTALNFD